MMKEGFSVEHPIIPQSFSPELQNHLSGRHLLASEIPFSEAMILDHLNNGHIAQTSGVQSRNGQLTCVRCGNKDQSMFYAFPCRICNRDCAYCRSCIMMGRVSECARLYHWTGPELLYAIPDQVMRWDGMLSGGQQTASQRAIDAVNEKGELLVWAVCVQARRRSYFQPSRQRCLPGNESAWQHRVRMSFSNFHQD